MPGLANRGRVADWRDWPTWRAAERETYIRAASLGGTISWAWEHSHWVIATGEPRVGPRCCFRPWSFRSANSDGPGVYTPDDLAVGIVPPGPVVVFDLDNYYMDGASDRAVGG